ncbi:protein-methionine-sulfoxide reductase catalytic subunit MsrP [Plastorhodobacter daqingensis]|uniref:Protein-methionine-sulfoxide reductase catalytic subunit MsrP n=1 Tax=Plastorhodobacter daqingensis TaxID=1387281 RepID=A0ABW2UFZ9_9RHOB
MTPYRYPVPRAAEITPETAWVNRRTVLAGMVAAGLVPTGLRAESSPFSTDEPLTDPEVATGYCNFFEFGTGKDDPARLAHLMRTDPWSVTVSGAVERPGQIPLEDLLAFPQEERIYRLRCVEAWSMVIPWTGFPLSRLLEQVGPTSEARYVEFETLHDPQQMPNQTSAILDWPYREALRLDEAMHPLTILATGMYGAPLPNQNGAPLRLVVPWKYGFKSIKSIVAIRLLPERPVSSWQARAPREYGFFANVNPEVRHPRWHQATERRLHDGRRIRTEMFNGYGEHVAHLYAGMDLHQDY